MPEKWKKHSDIVREIKKNNLKLNCANLHKWKFYFSTCHPNRIAQHASTGQHGSSRSHWEVGCCPWPSQRKAQCMIDWISPGEFLENKLAEVKTARRKNRQLKWVLPSVLTWESHYFDVPLKAGPSLQVWFECIQWKGGITLFGRQPGERGSRDCCNFHNLGRSYGNLPWNTEL